MLLALYALVAISLVFAQRCLRVEQPVNHADLAAFALPNGEIPTLCAGAAKTEHGNGKHNCKACETCSPSTTPGLAGHHDSEASPPHRVAVVVDAPADARAIAKTPRDVRSRAPPGAGSMTS